MRFQLNGNTEDDHDEIDISAAGALCAVGATPLFPITVLVSPIPPLADGAGGAAGTLSFSQSQLCQGSTITVGVGFWTVSNARFSDGDAAELSIDGGASYQASVEVLNELDMNWPGGPRWVVSQQVMLL